MMCACVCVLMSVIAALLGHRLLEEEFRDHVGLL